MKKSLFLKNKKSQRGVALIFSLGILGLMVVLGLTFASLSFMDQTASRSSTERLGAKLLAKSTVERVVAALENNSSLTNIDMLISGNPSGMNNDKHFDQLWKLITYHADVPGAGQMQVEMERRIRGFKISALR